jgi:hypothetical protein
VLLAIADEIDPQFGRRHDEEKRHDAH